MNLTIGRIYIEFLESAPNYSRLTDAQADAYRLMWAIASVKGDRPAFVDFQTFLDLLQLTRPEAFYKRLENLQRKGRIKFRNALAA